MNEIMFEWGGILLRWVHIITAIAWIGSSFYFMHLDAALKKIPEILKGGEAWEVHGGGFYQVRKYLVAPDTLPREMIWHKWQSYSTWISGFFLLVWVYYLSSELFLIDPEVQAISPATAAAIGVGSLVVGWLIYDFLVKSPLSQNELLLAGVGFTLIVALAWALQQVFSVRGALLHTGALMGTIMSGNVFSNIIPNQKKIVAALIAGETPDPAYGSQAKTRSRHNNYLTLPVIFLMMSSHYPAISTSTYGWVIVGLVLVAGSLVRHFYNERHAGRGNAWWTWVVAALALAACILLSAIPHVEMRQLAGLDGPTTRAVALHTGEDLPESVEYIIAGRCAMCHSATPAWPGLIAPPKGVLLETPAQIIRQANAIYRWAVATTAMPPQNITLMQHEERVTLARWVASR